jgi:hypothetical protein
MLCNLCQRLDQYAYLKGIERYRELPQYNLKYLEKSSTTCELCQLLISKALLYPEIHDHGISVGVTPGKVLSISTKGPGSFTYCDEFPLCTPPHTIGDDHLSVGNGQLCNGRLALPDSSAPACFDLAKNLLEECQSSHEK